MQRVILRARACAAAFLLISQGAVLGQANAPTAEIVSMAIESADAMSGIVPTPRTRIGIKVTTESEIVRAQPHGSRLISFTDAKGVDLLQRGMEWRARQKYFTNSTENGIELERPRIDGKTIYFPINVTATPTKGSNTINVQAILVLHCYPPEGSPKKTSGPIDLPGAVGTVALADYKMTFRKSGSGHDGKVPITLIEFETGAIVQKISFLDAQGKELKTVRYTRESPPSDNSIGIGIESALLPNIQQLDVEYLAPTIIQVAIDISAGLGL